MVVVHECDDSSTSLKEQKALVKEHLQDELKLNDEWYVIDHNWFAKWKEYVSYDATSDLTFADADDSSSPGPIDNSAITAEEGNVRPSLLENVNYALVPKIVWDNLVKWYGHSPNSCALARVVVEHGAFVKECKVEVYLLELYLAYYTDPKDGTKAFFSEGLTIGDLEVHMRKMFSIPENEEVRLMGTLGSTYEQYTDKDGTLNKAKIMNGHYIVICKKVDGKWPNLNTYKNMDTSDSVWRGGASGYSRENTSSSVAVTKTTSSWAATNSNSNKSYESSSSSYSYFDRHNKPGLCGLSNLGNTCFMNSALQCMSNVPKLKGFFLDKSLVKRDLNRSNPLGMKGHVAEAYAELMETMWSGKHSSTPPRAFKYAVGEFAPRFSGYAQQDAQELMAFLLDGLHEDLNRIKKKPYVEQKEAHDRPDKLVADEAWTDYKLRNDSIIIDTFHGLLKSRLVCPDCNKISVTFDPFCYLSLPLPVKKERIVEFCFIPKGTVKRPLLCKVKVPKNGLVSDMCEAVSRLFGVQAAQLMVADLVQHKVYKIYQHRTSLSSIADRAQIHVFEVEETGADTANVAVFLRKKSQYSSGTVLANPRIICLRKEIKFEDLYSQMFDFFNSTITTDVPMSQAHNGPVIPDPEEMSNGDTGDEMEVCTSPKPEDSYLFNISKVNEYANVTDETFKPGQTITFKSKSVTYLSLDFDEKTYENLINREELEAFEEHKSMNITESAARKVLELSDCLHLFTSEEQLGADDQWYCSQCKEHVQAFKKFDLWSLPDYLVIHLKRFSYSTYWRNKIDSFVDYPVEGLDLSEFVIGDKIDCKYDLIAVVNHFGSLGGGHYTAYAKNHLTGDWYSFDDSSVSAVSKDSVVTKSGYVLVYGKQKLVNSANGESQV